MIGQSWLRELSTVVCLLMFATTRILAQNCDAILQQGIRNTFQELRTGDFKTAFQAAYCNKTSGTQNKGNGVQLGGTYEQYSLNFNSNSSDTAESRVENCGSKASSMSDANYLKAMQSVADKDIVDTWRDCTILKYGVIVLGELNDSTLTITYKFMEAGSVTKAKVTKDVKVIGATCDSVVKEGTVIDTGGIIQTCTRDGDAAVTIVVNNDFKAAKFFIPKVVKPPEIAPNPFAGKTLISECRVLPSDPVVKPGIVSPNCPLDGPVGQDCSCPLFDGHGGIVRMMPGKSFAPSDAFWNYISRQYPNAIRAGN
jgi:hypothetical protein